MQHPRFMLLAALALIAWMTTAAPATAQWTPRYTDEVVFRDLSERAERFLDAIVRNDAISVRSALSPEARLSLTQSAVDRLYSNLLKEGGRVQEIGRGRIANLDELRGYDDDQPVIVHVPVHLATKSVTAQVTFQRKTPLAPITKLRFLSYEGETGRDGRGYTAREAVTRAPDYANRNLFRERETMVGEGSEALPAMLAMPLIASEALKVPGVVLVAGVEPTDLDFTRDSAAPFRDIAQGLATRGIATLRYTNRPKAHPGRGEDAESSAASVVLADAVAAVEALKALPQVDPNRITVIGYRVGGTLAPLIAEESGASQVVLLNAPAPPIDRHLRNWIRAHGEWEDRLTTSEHRETVERALAGHDAMTVDQLHSARPIILHPPAFWQDVRVQDPMRAMSTLPLRFALLFSEGDSSVDEEDRTAWREAAESAGRRGHWRTYASLDARFLPVGDEPAVVEPNARALNVSETLISDIERFVLQGRLRDS